MNIGAPWPGLIEAEHRVLVMQTKLHRWAKADPGRRFDDLANLVYDPAFLVTAWNRVRGNKGAYTSRSAPSTSCAERASTSSSCSPTPSESATGTTSSTSTAWRSTRSSAS